MQCLKQETFKGTEQPSCAQVAHIHSVVLSKNYLTNEFRNDKCDVLICIEKKRKKERKSKMIIFH
jgi:hypothetical protein